MIWKVRRDDISATPSTAIFKDDMAAKYRARQPPTPLATEPPSLCVPFFLSGPLNSSTPPPPPAPWTPAPWGFRVVLLEKLPACAAAAGGESSHSFS